MDNWMNEQWLNSHSRKYRTQVGGYIESACQLVHPRNTKWSHQELREATAFVRPLTQNYFTSTPSQIVMRLAPQSPYIIPEDWCLGQDGMCYSCGLLMEDVEFPQFDSSEGHPARSLWIDLTIRRIALEILTHTKIYKALGVGTNESWHFVIRHGGLLERVLYVGDLKYLYYTTYRPLSSKEFHTWSGVFTQTLVEEDMVSLVWKIANSLVKIFGTHEVSKDIVKDIIDFDA